jgi:ankyrin repeat protein
MFMSSRKGHEKIVRFLLEEGSNAKSTTKTGTTALHVVAESGYEAVVKLLLETGKVDVDSKVSSGQTPLWIAAYDGHEAELTSISQPRYLYPQY